MRPLFGDAGVAPIVFSIAFMILLLVALFTIQVDDMVGERDRLLAQKRRASTVGWILATVALVARLAVLLVPRSRFYVLATLTWLLFFVFVIWGQLRTLLRQKEVTGEIISMSVAIYLLLGVAWGLLYFTMFEYRPDAFNLGGATELASAPLHGEHLVPIFVYFSLTTLATIGYGDITPLSLPARYAAVAEGITGQFYLAILVARLVSMHMSRSAHQTSGVEPRRAESEARR